MNKLIMRMRKRKKQSTAIVELFFPTRLHLFKYLAFIENASQRKAREITIDGKMLISPSVTRNGRLAYNSFLERPEGVYYYPEQWYLYYFERPTGLSVHEAITNATA